MQNQTESPRVFGVTDWNRWLEQLAQSIFGMTAGEFEAAYDAGKLADSGVAQDIGAMLPLIRKLRRRLTS